MNLFTMLGVVFIVLKLLGVITWSWWLVTATLWVSAVLGFLLTAGVFAVATKKTHRRRF